TVHALVAQNLKVLRRDLLLRLGRVADAKTVDVTGSYASEWLVIGPFGDAGDFYHAVPFAPELAFPSLHETPDGRYRPVQPRGVLRKPHEAQVRFEEPGSGRNGCFYGLHQVQANQAAACYAELQCHGAFELFVNGAVAYRCERAGTRVGPGFRIPIALHK